MNTAMKFFLICILAVSGAAFAGESAPDRLAGVLAAQPEETQARYQFRHPAETLEFFGIKPGMTVMEGLPGGGWYSKILLQYLGSDGRLIGADYSMDMYPLFGFFSEERLKEKAKFVQTFPEKATEWGGEGGASAAAFSFGAMPDELKGTADAAVMIRAMHNLARFEKDGGFLTAAVKDIYAVLKPGGVLGVVQHQARDEMPDEWASGKNGYLKDDFLIEALTAAGFEFAGMSDINFNDKDQPTDSDIVWRLPPSLATSRENPELKAELEAVGESNRMTLKFRKPE